MIPMAARELGADGDADAFRCVVHTVATAAPKKEADQQAQSVIGRPRAGSKAQAL
jgi:hypothetical protein